jgi:hypothetical protein
MNAAVAYYVSAQDLSTSGSPYPRPPRRSGERRGTLAALLATVAVVLTAALGVVAI